jgi:hypothetical protein
MRFLIAGLALALTMASAQAQVGQNAMDTAGGVGRHAQDAQRKGDAAAEAAKVKANEKAYNAALHNLPDKNYDPWHGVR